MMDQKTIAWIEDDIDVIDAVVAPLRKAGFEILEFRTYSQAIEGIHKIGTSSLVILDLILPPGNSEYNDPYLGLRFLRDLRSKNLMMPVIVFSVIANSTEVSAEEIISLNAISISKPVRPSFLKSRVEQLIEEGRS